MLKYDRRYIEDVKKLFKRGSINKDVAFIAVAVLLFVVIMIIV